MHTVLSHICEARAIENQCYVLAAAQVGKHNNKRKSYGHALAVDPWGDIVADAGGYDGAGTMSAERYVEDEDAVSPVEVPSIILCDIDREKINAVRERIPIQQHRANAVIRFG
jgi:predicted amidohydrolase